MPKFVAAGLGCGALMTTGSGSLSYSGANLYTSIAEMPRKINTFTESSV